MPKYVEVNMAVQNDNSHFLNEGEHALPTVIDTEQVRNFHPRKGNRPGTRIVFKNGAAVPVLNAYPEVAAMFGITTTWTIPAPTPAADVLDEEDEDNVVSLSDR